MKVTDLIDFKQVAALLAREDSDLQGEFFEIFCNELFAACHTIYKAQLQLASARDKISETNRNELLCMFTDENK